MKELRVFGNRIKRKQSDMFETNLLIKLMEKSIDYVITKNEKMGDFNFMIISTILFFLVIAGSSLYIFIIFIHTFLIFSHIFVLGMDHQRNYYSGIYIVLYLYIIKGGGGGGED